MNYHEDRDIAPCGRCGKDVVLDHDPPCEHGYVACPECQHPSVCADCRRTAFTDMCAGDDYVPAADIFFDHAADLDKPYCPIHRRRSCTCGYGDRA